MSDKGFEGGFGALQPSDRRLTAENLDLGVRIWKLEEELRVCRAHSEYLEQRSERLSQEEARETGIDATFEASVAREYAKIVETSLVRHKDMFYFLLRQVVSLIGPDELMKVIAQDPKALEAFQNDSAIHNAIYATAYQWRERNDAPEL